MHESPDVSFFRVDWRSLRVAVTVTVRPNLRAVDRRCRHGRRPSVLCAELLSIKHSVCPTFSGREPRALCKKSAFILVIANLTTTFLAKNARSLGQMAEYFDAWRPGEGQVAIEDGCVELSDSSCTCATSPKLTPAITHPTIDPDLQPPFLGGLLPGGRPLNEHITARRPQPPHHPAEVRLVQRALVTRQRRRGPLP